jgi:putative flippase GtrA
MTLLKHARRYLIVGAGSAATDLTTYAVLAQGFGVHPLVANLISRPLGGLFSFTFNKLWTFEKRELAGTHRQFARYWIVWFTAYALSEGLVWLFFDTLHFGKFTSKICAEGLVGIFNFFCLRHWAFR